jgi:phosphoribosylformimino-5-aminoimidazole carboxamide ribonucleotide (ProFAR) isomerase
MIVGLDAMGASVYRGWKEKNFATIEEMDKAFEESCKEHGIWVD